MTPSGSTTTRIRNSGLLRRLTTFFAPQDTFSCPNQCTNLEACNFYTSYIRDGIHKCFLFKACDNPEECELCETVPV